MLVSFRVSCPAFASHAFEDLLWRSVQKSWNSRLLDRTGLVRRTRTWSIVSVHGSHRVFLHGVEIPGAHISVGRSGRPLPLTMSSGLASFMQVNRRLVANIVGDCWDGGHLTLE